MQKDKFGNPLEAGDVCTYEGDAFDPFGEVPEDYEGDPCRIKTLGPSQGAARVTFEGDPDTYKVNTAALRFHHRPSAAKPKPEPKPEPKPDPKPKGDE